MTIVELLYKNMNIKYKLYILSRIATIQGVSIIYFYYFNKI